MTTRIVFSPTIRWLRTDTISEFVTVPNCTQAPMENICLSTTPQLYIIFSSATTILVSETCYILQFTSLINWCEMIAFF